jgi:hypothetical protein
MSQLRHEIAANSNEKRHHLLLAPFLIIYCPTCDWTSISMAFSPKTRVPKFLGLAFQNNMLKRYVGMGQS